MPANKEIDVIDAAPTNGQLAPVEPQRGLLAPTNNQQDAIAQILAKAVDGGMDPAGLEKIVALYERLSDRNAAQEFAQAMSRFQAKCPSIKKTSTANITTRGGGSYQIKYAELDEIARTVRPLLDEEGLSYAWDSDEEAGKLTCICTVRHVNGHSVTAKFSCPTDTSAAMSGAQKSAAALTYARRQSLIQALGLTTCDQDTDGAPPVARTISEDQAANLQMALEEVGADRRKFLEWAGVESLAKFPATKLDQAWRFVDQKRKEIKNGGPKK